MYQIPLKQIVASTILAGILIGCSSDDDDDTNAGMVIDDNTPSGLVSLASALPVGEAIGTLRQALDNNEALLSLPVIDHQLNAINNDLELRPTSLQLFGNPLLGTPLMQQNQMAGIDLPQKILAWENAEGNTNVAYNSAAYLQQRHALDDSEEAVANALTTITGALANLAAAASGTSADDAEAPPPSSVTSGEGVVTVVSAADFDTTYNTLISSIENNEALTIVAQVNHTMNAENVDLELEPTRLVIFGNPLLGTPLLQAEQSVGIDLPQKMLVFENAGVVTIAYNDPVYVAERHGITGQDDGLTTISGALANLANGAAAAP